MEQKRTYKRNVFYRILSILLCLAIVSTSMPMAALAATTKKKIIVAEPKVIQAGENTTITWNFETERTADIKVMNGDELITYLGKDVHVKGDFKTQTITWNGKDSSGRNVKTGTYQIVIEAKEEIYKEFKSITTVSVINGSVKNIGIATNPISAKQVIYGSGGSNQGIKKVTLGVVKDRGSNKKVNATVLDDLWYAEVSTTAYSLYDITASIQSGSKVKTEELSAVRHVFRITDRLHHLASMYYDDVSKVTQLENNNPLPKGYENDGALVKKNIIISNPSKDITLDISKDTTKSKQRLGVIDQLQRITSSNPVSLTMGNNFYSSEDLRIDGYNPIGYSRMYNSRSYSYSEFGLNWTHSYTYYLQDIGKNIVIQFEDGHVELYKKLENGSFEVPAGLTRKLEQHSNGDYTLTIDEGRKLEFSKGGLLKQIVERNGQITSLTYQSQQLVKVETISGSIAFSYNKDGTLKSIKDHSGREVTYGYTHGDLTSVKDVNGNTSKYYYDTLGRLSKVVSAENITLYELTYDETDRVLTKAINGNKYEYIYDDENLKITCIEPNGNKIIFNYTKDYKIKSEEYMDGIIHYEYKGDEAADTKVSSKEKTSTEIASDELFIKDDKKVLSAARQVEVLSAVVASGSTSNGNTTENILELHTHNMNTATGDQTNNTLYPQFRVTNVSTGDINLSDVTLRYYYTIDGNKLQNFFCDYSNIGSQYITGKFYKLETPWEGADHFLEVGFREDAGTLKSGESVTLHTRIGKEDWSVFTPGNDYSQNLSKEYTYFDKVDMYLNGQLIWGKGSTGIDITLPEENPEPVITPVPPVVVNPTPAPSTSGNSNTVDNSRWEPVVENKEEVLGDTLVKISMYNSGNTATTSNNIHPMIKLVNTSDQMVKLEDLKIRYYYTVDSKKQQNFWCDWSSVGSNNITGTFVTLDEPYEGADTYLEIGFKANAGYINIGETIDIHTRISNSDWSDYDISNDYSNQPTQNYMDWDQVDVYKGQEKVWGKGVVPREYDLEEEYVEYGDTTYTPVEAHMYNVNIEDRSNTISPRFRVYNTSEKGIKLSDIKIKYFYTTDGEEEQIFEVDWAGIGSTFHKTLWKSDITSGFTPVGDDNLHTNCVLDIGFTRDDIVIEPEEYIELNVRVHRENWTQYVQSNDFSLNQEANGYVEWQKIAVFVADKWAWGSIPLSYGTHIEPEKEEVYESDSMESFGASKDKAGNEIYYTYDNSGNITSNVDALGNKTSYTYNENQQVTSVVDALGHKTSYQYDTKGNITEYIDPLGNTIEYTYNSNGFLTKVEYADGTSESLSYDNKGNITQLTDAMGNITKLSYDSLNRITKYTDPLGNQETYEYAKDGNVTKVTDALGYQHSFDYNKDGKMTQELDKNNNTILYTYNSITGDLESITDPLGVKTQYEYDNMGNLSTITLANGSISSYEYDLLGRITTNRNELGEETKFLYDSSGNVTEEIDSLGNTTKYTYDKLNQLTKITDSLSNVTTYEYDKLGRRIKEIDSLGGTITYKYDQLGNLLSTTDAMGNTESNTYDVRGRLLSTTDSNGYETSYQYDALGRLTKTIDSLGNEFLQAYDKNGNITMETDALGNKTNYVYDGLGQITSITDSLGNKTSYKYDGNGNVLEEVDAKGNKTTFTYDGADRLLTEKNALSQVTKYTYSIFGNLRRVTYADGTYIGYTYDKLGRVLTQTDALGNVTKNEYNKQGLLTGYTNEEGNKTTYEYNAIGQKVKEVDPLGNISRWSYDKNGNITTFTNGLEATTTYQYNKNGQVTMITDALGYKTSYEYDKNGNQTKVTDGLGHTTNYKYNGNNQLVEVTNALGQKTVYSYNGNQQRTEEIRVGVNGNQVTSYSYDVMGRVSRITGQTGLSTSYIYDSLGNLTRETLEDGSSVRYTYDKLSNLLTTTYSDGKVVTNTYNKVNQLETMTDWNGTSKYTYDDAGRLEAVRDDKNQVISYTYTKTGNKESITYSNGKKVTYQYDKAENLVKVVDNKKVTTYTYDKAGNITKKALPNGMDTNYTYNDNGHLIKQEEVKGSVVKETLTLDYDQAYNVIRKEHREGSNTNITTYTYDAIHQLTSVRDNNGVRNYGYDEFNNRSYKEEVGDSYNYESYLYDGRNQLVATISSKDTKTYNYDTRGNLVTVSHNGTSKESYEFDGTGGLSKAVVDGITTEYSYNGLGNRILVTTKNEYEVTSKKEYVYDVTSTYQDIIEVVDTKEVENKLTSTHSIFVYGVAGSHGANQGFGQLSVETDGIVGYYKLDELGSISKIYDSLGNTKASIHYDEFGNVTNPEEVDTLGNIFAYTGHVYDTSTGLYYAKARYYDANVGRFLSEDTYRGDISQPITMNRYAYGNNNPIKYTDPSGNSALLTLIAKASAGALADYLIQATMNYFFNPTTQFNLQKSFTQVNKWQIARSALEGFIPWKSTRNKFAKAALAAAGDVLANALDSGSKYSERQAVMDFGTGFISDLAGGEISELVSKYGAKYVANGLKRLNMSDSFIKKVTGIDLNAKKTPVSTYAGYQNPASNNGGTRKMNLQFFADNSGVSKTKYVNLASEGRTKHILFGDSTGGGHIWPGAVGKTSFPKGWSGDKIMDTVSDIATDPKLNWSKNRVVKGVQRYEVVGTRGGVKIKVVTDGKDIITAFPVK